MASALLRRARPSKPQPMPIRLGLAAILRRIFEQSASKEREHMDDKDKYATTEMGSWNPVAHQYTATLETWVADAFGADGPEGYDFEAICREYRAAVNERLEPFGVCSVGLEDGMKHGGAQEVRKHGA